MLKKQKVFITACAAAIIIGCGGSGDGAGSDASTQSVTPPTNVVNSYFSQNPLLLPDVSSYYSQLCGARTNAQSAVVVDLNNDGKKDLLFTLWCGQAQNGVYQPASVPVKNTIIAFVQQNDGTFIDNTYKVFGTKLPNMGGIATTGMVADLNGDGLPDIVYNVTQEDGRSPDPVTGDITNNFAINVVLLSQGDGTYSIVPYGPSSWWLGSKLVKNSNGGFDVYSRDYTSKGIIYRFLGNKSLEVIEESFKAINSNIILFFNSNYFEDDSVITQNGIVNGLEFYKKISGIWEKLSSWSLPSSKIQFGKWTSWQGGHGLVPVITIDENDYVSGVLDESCIFRPTPQSEKNIIIGMTAYKFKNRFNGGDIIEGVGMEHYFGMLSFSTKDGVIVKNKISIDNEQTNIQKFSFTNSCRDINNDGYDDIIINTWGNNPKPIIYLNDKSGNLNLINTSNFPSSNINDGDSSMILEDINGDKINDILYWPVAGLKSFDSKPVNYYLFPGINQLSSRP